MPIFLYIKIGIIILISSTIIGTFVYIKHLRSEIKIHKENNIQLEYAIKEQNKVIELKEKEYIEISSIKDKLNKQVKIQNKKILNLTKKFNQTQTGEERDFGNLAFKKPKLIENIINKGTKNVNRCLELISGAVPKEGEKNAECQEIIDVYFGS